MAGLPNSPEENPIDALVRLRFPGSLTIMPSIFTGPNRSNYQEQKKRIEEADKYRQELKELSEEQLQKLLQDTFTERANEARIKREEEERRLSFNQPHANLDIAHWSRMSLWTLDEVVALSLDKDPRIVQWETVRKYVQISPLAAQYEARFMIVSRAKAAGQLWDPMAPGVFLAWADRMKFEMPALLADAVKALGIQVADWKTLFDQQTEILEKSVAEKTRLLKQIEHSRSSVVQSTEKPLGTRERESLLKLVIGMAIKGYGYDPRESRSLKVKEIADDLLIQGIPLEADTVRKYLHEAKDLLPGSETEQRR